MAEAVSGDIDVVAVAEIDLSARTVSGDVEVRAGTLRGLRASTTSGDLKIAGRFSSDGAFAVDTVSGDGLIAPVGDLSIEMTTSPATFTPKSRRAPKAAAAIDTSSSARVDR